MNGESGSSRWAPGVGIVWPGLLLVGLGIVGYYTTRSDLETLRPEIPDYQVPGPPTPPGLSAVHARLWEDPLEAAYRDPHGKTGEPGWLAPLRAFVLIESQGYPVLKRAQAAAKQILEDHRFGSSDAVRRADLAEVRRVFRAIVDGCTRGEGKGHQRFLCMPVLLPGGAYDEDKQTRLKTRYALLSALAVRHYRLSLPDRMSYVKIPICVEHRAIGSLSEVELAVPVKLFAKDSVRRSDPYRDKDYSAILVCWVNESQLGDRPLMALLQILDGLYGGLDAEGKGSIDLHILGPNSSDTLLAMAKEDWNSEGLAEQWRQRGDEPADGTRHRYLDVLRRSSPFLDALQGPDGEQYRQFAALREKYRDVLGRLSFRPYSEAILYSFRATVSARSLDKGSPEKPLQKALSRFTALEGHNHHSGLRVVRAIGDDECLVQKLYQELNLRRAWPDAKKDRMVLIVEDDTLYGRALPELFNDLLRSHRRPGGGKVDDGPPMPTHDNRTGEEALDPRLLIFRYKRGIDGISGSQARQTKAKQGADDESTQGVLPEESPRGPAQLDYLRRAEDCLAHFGEQHELTKSNVVAIGVLGTDVYDKLLVLRALRKRFPGACFFTTDMDARFFSPSEFEFTHNLVVASHFPPELHHDLQRGVPPFRDSYQTSTFFATLLAINDGQLVEALKKPPRISENGPWDARQQDGESFQSLQPLVFEVGRGDAYQLTPTGELDDRNPGATAGLFPISPRENPWFPRATRRALAVIVMIVSLMFLGTVTIPPLGRRLSKFRRQIVTVVLAALTGLLMMLLFPKIWLLVTLAVLALACRVTWPVMNKKLLLALATVAVMLIGVAWVIWNSHHHADGHPFSLWDGISIWPPCLIRLLCLALTFVLLVRVHYLLARDHSSLRKMYVLPPKPKNREDGHPQPKEKPALPLPDKGRRRLILWVLQLKRRFFLFNWSKNIQNLHGSRLLHRYCQWGQFRHRLCRALPPALVFCLFCGLLLRLTDTHDVPVRDPVARWLSQAILWAAGIFMLVLVFLVLDAIQLCRQLIHALSEDLKRTKHVQRKVAPGDRRIRPWPKYAVRQLNHGDRCPEQLQHELLHVRVIVDCSEEVTWIVFYPLLVFLVMLLGRLPVFANSGLPWPKVLLAGFIFAIILFGATELRRSARRARKSVLSRLRDALARATAGGDDQHQQAELYKQAIKDTEAEQGGAFRPITHDPVFQILAVPFGGIGGLVLVEELLHWF